MNYRILGKTGLKVSEIGYGTWQLVDGGFWIGADPQESLRSLHRYAELGGNFLDTAWVYGRTGGVANGDTAEEFIGRFLKETGKRDEIIIASKVPPLNMSWPALPNVPIEQVFPADHIEKFVDASLQNLKIDSLDLMQFHVWQDDFADADEWKETIQKISKTGKVKHWGLSINDYQPENCLKTLETGLIGSVQCIFNIFHQKPAAQLFSYAKQHNIGLIVRVPLDEGGLAGSYNLNTKFPEGDFRNNYFTPPRLKELVARTDQLKTLLGSEAVTLAELDLRYILSFPEVSTVIPGMRKLKNVEANTSYSDGRILSPELLSELKNHAWERNFYIKD